jgi:hypothetical protein
MTWLVKCLSVRVLWNFVEWMFCVVLEAVFLLFTPFD